MARPAASASTDAPSRSERRWIRTAGLFRAIMDDMAITPPIFVCTDDVYVFRDKDEAESFLEPVDVKPDDKGYDAEGRLLHVLVRGEVKRGRWSIDQSNARVELVLAEDQPTHREDLRARLAEWLRGVGDVKPGAAEATLEELVVRAVQHSETRTLHSPGKAFVWLAAAVALVVAGWWWGR